MPEPMTNADDAAAYVLGTLGARERRRFEARLKKSNELRTMVRSLEMGSIGVAMAAPRREPPVRIWDGIQAAVIHECEKHDRTRKRIWLRSAVGIAACAVVGWFAFTFWNHRASSVDAGLIVDSRAGTVGTAAKTPEPVIASSRKPNAKPVAEPRRETRSPEPVESAALRERLGDLENQVAHLAQTVTQQQASAAADFNQLTFLNVLPEGSDGHVQIGAPSPELRRALLLGVARQLGWQPTTPPPVFPPQSPTPPSTPPPSTQFADANPPAPQPNSPAAQNEPPVDFVDLPPVETPSPESQTASVDTQTSPPAETSAESSSSNSIPAFVSGTNLVFAIDSSVVPVGTETVSFYSGNAGGQSVFRGTLALTPRATVVTMPIFLQVRTWDSGTPLQGSPGVIRFNSVSSGSTTFIGFVLPNPGSSSP
jgi:hypothetical protein